VGEGWPGGGGGGPVVLAAGSRIAGYVLEEEIGAGGMAVVFRARDERLDRLVALKVLAPGLTANEEFRRRFLRESRAAAAVDDPHVLPVYEAGQAGGVLFIAMRYVSGGDVRGLLRRQGPLPPGRAAAIISPVASALDAAHGAGLVHRDVKPANMLIDARPGRPDHVYLSDFGLAKGGSASVLTGTGAGPGTVAYMAPEQIQGGVVAGRADQYALGCAAFELLCGGVPFERDQDMAVIYAHLSVRPPSLSARCPGLPSAVDEVLGRVLAKAPGDRYASCGEFAEALREALGVPGYDRDPGAVPASVVPARPAPGAPGAAAGATVIGPARAQSGDDARGRPLARHGSPRRQLTLAAVVITVAAIAGVGLAWAGHPASRGSGHPGGSSRTAPAASSFTGGALTALPDRGEPATYLADRDGGPAQPIAVAVWSATTGKLIKVLPHTCCLDTQGVSAFPDLRHHRLFVSTSLNDVYNVVDSHTGRVTGQATIDGDPLSISADGSMVVVHNAADGSISVVRLADGAAGHWTNVTPLAVNDVTWSPDGQDLVLTTERGIDVLAISKPGRDIDSGRFYPADPSCQATNIAAIPGTSQIVDAEQCPQGIVLAYFDLKTAMTIRRVAVAGAYVPPRAIKVLAGLSVDGSGRHVIGEWDNPDGLNQNPVFVVRGDRTVVIGHTGVEFYGWY
jgi:hypothetical protein